jgi:hypothetical protein
MPKYGTDYSRSAIDLNNAPEVRSLLTAYGKALADRDRAFAAHEAAIAEMPTYRDLARTTMEMSLAHQAVRAAVDQHGSLQDIDAGLYAIKQARASTGYSVSTVRELAPDYSRGIIVEQVDARKLLGLHKGGLITDDELQAMEIITPLAPAYIIGLAPKEVAQ